jgi:hypothetical protein
MFTVYVLYCMCQCLHIYFKNKLVYEHQKKHARCAQDYFELIFYDVKFKYLSESLDF